MSELSFCFESHQVRVLGDNINPLFIAADVCSALGYKRACDAVRQHLDSEDLIKQAVKTNGGRQLVNCINESGLYALIFGSKLPSAKRFKKWVTSEVLPAIRKTGQYITTQPQTLTVNQQSKIQRAVRERVKLGDVDYKTVYRALKNHFQVARYSCILESDFDNAMLFIANGDLKEAQKEKPIKALPVESGSLDLFASLPSKPKAGENIARFLSDVYMIRRHLERQRDAIDQLLKRLDAPNEEEQMIKALEALGL